MPQFMALLSYSQEDDKCEDGRVSDFRQRLENAARQRTGEREFRVFQDVKDIPWGSQWKKQIEQALGDVFVLICIMTPSYFKSQACQEEYELFLKREQKLKRVDLILPVYWLDCDELNDPKRRDSNAWASGLAAHQWADWRPLRFKPLESPEVRQFIDGLALQLKQVLQAVPAVAATSPQGGEESLIAEAAVPELSREAGAKAVAKEPPTRIVDAMGRGDYISLVEAIAQSQPGCRLQVRPGFYPGTLTLDKPLEIIGDGDVNEIIIQATGGEVILFKANMGIVRNLALKQVGGGQWYAVDITQGRLVLEGCDITSQSLSCVAVHGSADPVVRHNRIRDGKASGIFVYDNGQGTFEDNEVFGNAFSGIEVKEGGNPVVRRNHIHDGKTAGIFVYENGQGTFEDNEVFGNALSGIQVKEGGNPVVRRNRIHDGKAGGIFVNENGQGTFEDNDVFGNAYAGIEVKEGGNPVVQRNRITENRYEAVWVHNKGKGTFEDNDLRGNLRGSWDIEQGCEVKRARNQEDSPTGT